MKALPRELFGGDTEQARSFRYALLVFDLVTICYVVATSFITPTHVLDYIDAVIGVFLLAEFGARMYATSAPRRELLHPATLADAAAIASFLAPIAGEGFAFLRVLRTLRLMHSLMLLERLRADFGFFRRDEDVFVSATDPFTFVFVMTGLVYVSQHRINPGIGTYADALYFTITALTTTGFGDITPRDTLGRLLTLVIMVTGVTLFLRLSQTLFRPPKVRFECPSCALLRHDPDAVHCKHCGVVLRLPERGRGLGGLPPLGPCPRPRRRPGRPSRGPTARKRLRNTARAIRLPYPGGIENMCWRAMLRRGKMLESALNKNKSKGSARIIEHLFGL